VPAGTFAALGFLAGWVVVFFPPPQADAGVIATAISSAATQILNKVLFILN